MTAVRVLSGAVSLFDGLMVIIFYSLGWFFIASVRFAVEQWRVVRQGVTSFELDHHIKVSRRLSRPRFILPCLAQPKHLKTVCLIYNNNNLYSPYIGIGKYNNSEKILNLTK